MTLIGRDEELGRLRRLGDALRAGRGGTTVLVGEPGVGKTSLLGALREETAGLAVLAATGVDSEQRLPFAALGELVAPLHASLAARTDEAPR